MGHWIYVDGGEWPASRAYHCTPRERDPGVNWIETCVGPIADDMTISRRYDEVKIPDPTWTRVPTTRSSSS
jgi:hypothetical protein